MPTIPDYRSLGRVNPTGQTPVAVVSNPGAVSSALGDLADQVGESVDYVDRVNAGKAKYSAAVAETDFLKARDEQDAQAEMDPEHKDIQKRYSETLSKRYDEIGDTLTDPRARQIYDMNVRRHLDNGITRAGLVEHRRTVDYEGNNITNRLQMLRDSAVAGGDLESLSLAAKDLLETGAGAGYVKDQPTAEITYRKWLDDTTVGKLNAMQPAERLAAMEQPFFKALPLDKQVELRRQAEAGVADQEALVTAETILASDLPTDQREALIDNINTPEQRALVRQKYDQLAARKDKIETSAADDLFKSYLPEIMAGRTSVANIPLADQRVLGNSLVTLKNAEASSAAAGNSSPYGKFTDPALIIQLTDLKNNRDFVGLRKLIQSTPVGKFSETDYQAFATTTTDGVSKEAGSLLDGKSRITTLLATKKIKPSDIRTPQVLIFMDEWTKRYQELNPGKPIPDKELDAALDRALIDTPVPGRLWGTNDVPTYSAGTPAEALQRVTAVNEQWAAIESKSPGLAAAARAQFPNYTEEQLIAEIAKRMPKGAR